MTKMLSLKAFLNERLTAAAEEIFGAVEKTISEYKEEISRSKDVEISRLRMQLRLLKSVSRPSTQQPLQQPHTQHQQQHHQSIHPVPAVEPAGPRPCEQDGCASMEQEASEPAQVKKEQHKTHREFWISHDEEQLEGLESDIKEFMSSPASLKSNLQDSVLPFHPYQNNTEENKEKPYCCSVCEKRFSNCSHLAAHIRTHTGERPYRCDICRKTFITTSALNRHQTIHTEGKQFVCNYCGKSFKWMESLGRHTRCVHKREENMPI